MIKPELPPGFYRWPSGRIYSHEELIVIRHRRRWCVVVRAAWEAKR